MLRPEAETARDRGNFTHRKSAKCVSWLLIVSAGFNLALVYRPVIYQANGKIYPQETDGAGDFRTHPRMKAIQLAARLARLILPYVWCVSIGCTWWKLIHTRFVGVSFTVTLLSVQMRNAFVVLSDSRITCQLSAPQVVPQANRACQHLRMSVNIQVHQLVRFLIRQLTRLNCHH